MQWNYELYNKGDYASEVGYYNMLSDAFKQLTASIDTKVRVLSTFELSAFIVVQFADMASQHCRRSRPARPCTSTARTALAHCS